jgi:hypothetical protein
MPKAWAVRWWALDATRGLEPRCSESKTGVLPLDDMATTRHVAGQGVTGRPPCNHQWKDRRDSNPHLRSHNPALYP